MTKQDLPTIKRLLEKLENKEYRECFKMLDRDLPDIDASWDEMEDIVWNFLDLRRIELEETE